VCVCVCVYMYIYIYMFPDLRITRKNILFRVYLKRMSSRVIRKSANIAISAFSVEKWCRISGSRLDSHKALHVLIRSAIRRMWKVLK
jgi:hypothetical protein